MEIRRTDPLMMSPVMKQYIENKATLEPMTE
jgi:hypothetical protein